MKKLRPEDLVAMDSYGPDHPLHIHLAYAYDALPNIFGPVYKNSAKLWLWKPLAKAVLNAADYLYETHRLYLKLYDGLRPVEAQQKMLETEIARNNPHWFEEPRVLSPPGQGAHPRAMAVDCEPVDAQGNGLDMGTVFDHLAGQTDERHNPAHRRYIRLTEEVKTNRAILNEAMQKGAEKAGIAIDLLDTEWWDFRLPAGIYDQYAPLSDSDLPPDMRMVTS